MLNTYIFGAHVKFLNYFNFTNFFKKGVLFVYDVTNSQSFENINDWLSAAKKLDKQMEKVKNQKKFKNLFFYSHFIWH